jgi:hypothetical protein
VVSEGFRRNPFLAEFPGRDFSNGMSKAKLSSKNRKEILKSREKRASDFHEIKLAASADRIESQAQDFL